jgi:hypothetical protein
VTEESTSPNNPVSKSGTRVDDHVHVRVRFIPFVRLNETHQPIERAPWAVALMDSIRFGRRMLRILAGRVSGQIATSNGDGCLDAPVKLAAFCGFGLRLRHAVDSFPLAAL